MGKTHPGQYRRAGDTAAETQEKQVAQIPAEDRVSVRG